MLRRWAVILGALLLLTVPLVTSPGSEGPRGPVGPAGSAGPEGPQVPPGEAGPRESQG